MPAGLSQKPDAPTEAVLLVGIVAFAEESLKPTLADQMDDVPVPSPLRFRIKRPSWSSGQSFARTASDVHTYVF